MSSTVPGLTGVKAIYARELQRFIPHKQASILVCGAGSSDRDVFQALGYEDVSISGMDLRDQVHGLRSVQFENAEELSFADDSFDYAVMHAAVHHTRLPHKVLTELFRVSRKGFLVIESRDSILMRVASRLGLTEQYEVAGNFAGHGVNGTDIPNFIYRWTEREVEKTIKTFAPHLNHTFEFSYSSHYPEGHGFGQGMRLLIKALKPVYMVFRWLLPKQQNHFAFFVYKPTVPGDLKSWVRWNKETGELEVDRAWIKSSYSKRLSR